MNEWVRSDAFLLLSLRCIWHLFRMAKCCHPSSSMLCTQKANNCLKQVNQKWMEEMQTVHLVKKRRKQRRRWQRFQQVLHYITFQLQCWVSEWCAEKKLYFHVLSRSIFSCVTWNCTLHTQLANSFLRHTVESVDVVYFISLLHTLVQFIIEFTLSLQWISQNNELRGKINILNKKWKWNATMHNDWRVFSLVSFASFNFKLFYFSSKL